MPKSQSQNSNVIKTIKQTDWGYTCFETKEQKKFKSKSLCDMNKRLHKTKCFTCALNDMKEYKTQEDMDLKELAKKMIINNLYEHSKVV